MEKNLNDIIFGNALEPDPVHPSDNPDEGIQEPHEPPKTTPNEG